jgi:hypothetical protein
VAVSSGGSAERSPISPWPSFGQHETIKAPERADLKAVPCPSPGSIMSSMPWMEGAPGVRITDLSISTFAHTSAGIFPLFSGLGGQIGGARLKHNGPLTAGRRRANDRCRRNFVVRAGQGEGQESTPLAAIASKGKKSAHVRGRSCGAPINSYGTSKIATGLSRRADPHQHRVARHWAAAVTAIDTARIEIDGGPGTPREHGE